MFMAPGVGPTPNYRSANGPAIMPMGGGFRGQIPPVGSQQSGGSPGSSQATQPVAPPTAYRNAGHLRSAFPGYQPGSARPATTAPQTTYSGQRYGGDYFGGNPQQQVPMWAGTTRGSQQGMSQSMSPMWSGVSAPTGGQATAEITSPYGTPVLPFGDPSLNQQTINRQFEASLGNMSPRSMLTAMRPAGNQMQATQGDQSMMLPFLTQQGTAGANALANTPYQMGLANANALLDWQRGQANDVLGQFGNQLTSNNALQGYGLNNLLAGMNFNTGMLGNRLGLGTNVLNSLLGPGSIYSNLLGGMSGMGGNLIGGLVGGAGQGLGTLMGNDPLAGILG